MAEKEKKIGEITHYFSNINVGIIKLSNPLKKGSKVKIVGNTSDFEQTVNEMQFDRKEIEEGSSGQEVGIKVKEKVREGDEVFLLG